jgi:hypothetical protein
VSGRSEWDGFRLRFQQVPVWIDAAQDSLIRFRIGELNFIAKKRRPLPQAVNDLRKAERRDGFCLQLDSRSRPAGVTRAPGLDGSDSEAQRGVARVNSQIPAVLRDLLSAESAGYWVQTQKRQYLEPDSATAQT